MQASSLSQPLVLWLFAGFFLLLALGALFAFVKARRRRRKEFFAEKPAEPASLAPTVADEALTRGLARTSASFGERLAQLFGRHPKLDPSALTELEETLLAADIGVGLTTRLLETLRAELTASRLFSPTELREALRRGLLDALVKAERQDNALAAGPNSPKVILFVGVNGVGKTTTIGKIAALGRAEHEQVVLAAGDTFRAAAVAQLAVWAERTGSKLIRGDDRADPAGVIYNAIDHAVKTKAGLVLADTAGRLHTKTELMDEIKKVKRAAAKARALAPDEVWLVVDATTGQNALQQAREFHQALGLSGVILTKLDGTAKGGVVVAIADTLGLPVRFVGVGEKVCDLRPFSARAFVDALCG